MIPQSQTLTAVRADHTTFRVTTTDSLGAPVDLSTAKISFSVKWNRDDADVDALIWKKNTAAGGSDAEIEVVDPAGGVFDIKLIPSDTVGEEPFENFSWDIEFILTGRRITPIIGTFVLVKDVTRGPA